MSLYDLHHVDGEPEWDDNADEAGYVARCTCGVEICGLPDLETAIDVLMDHASGRRGTR